MVKKNGKQPFDFLYLISLDFEFIPDAFYINKYIDIIEKLNQAKDTRTKIQGAAMKGGDKKGNWLLNFNVNKITTLKDSIK